MITLRPANERGHSHFNWLNSRHTFSFANYYDPQFTGVSDLRVINDDWVQGGAGFDTHPHRDMEIVSYVLEGGIEHKDTMGKHTCLDAGEVQIMSAGSGVWHSEYNASSSEPLNFLQIWILPDRKGSEPRYQEKDLSGARGITLAVSPDGRDGSLSIQQDASLYQVKLQRESAIFRPKPDRTYYLHLARGSMGLNGTAMAAGDGATVRDEDRFDFAVEDGAEALLIELRRQ